MPSIYHDRSVNPAAVTAHDLATIYDEFDLRTDEPGPADFFQPDTTYTRPVLGETDVFHVATVAWQWDGTPIAIGYAPVNLSGERCWELAFQGEWDWTRGWTVNPAASPMTRVDGAS